MKVRKLRQVLSDLGQVLSAAGSKKPAEDFAGLSKLMDGREDQSAEQFLNELREDIAPATPDQVVAGHVTQLLAAGTDEVMFERVMHALTKDRTVKKAQADAVAHGYIGGRQKWASKSAAFKAIEKEFVARRYDASKMKEVSRSRPW